MAGTKDRVGITLMGAKNAKGSGHHMIQSSSLHVLHDLVPPSADIIRKLDTMVEEMDTVAEAASAAAEFISASTGASGSDVCSADTMQTVIKASLAESEGSMFDKEIGSLPASNALEMADALWHCSSVFRRGSKGRSGKTAKLMAKHIWMFTNDDDPLRLHSTGDDSGESRVLRKAKDAAEAGIDFSLFYFNPAIAPTNTYGTLTPKRFRSSIFFHSLIGAFVGNSGDENSAASHIVACDHENVEMVCERVRQRQHVKRVKATVPFVIGDKVAMAVSLYSSIMKAKLRLPMRLHRVLGATAMSGHGQNDGSGSGSGGSGGGSGGSGSGGSGWEERVVISETRYIVGDTAEYVDKSQISHFQKYGHTIVPVLREEIARCKYIEQRIEAAVANCTETEVGSSSDSGSGKDPEIDKKAIAPMGLVLIGCRPLSWLEWGLNIRSSVFVYPNEAECKGSTTYVNLNNRSRSCSS